MSSAGLRSTPLRQRGWKLVALVLGVIALNAFVGLRTPLVTTASAAGSEVTFSTSDIGWTTTRHPSTPQNPSVYVSTSNYEDRAYLKFNTSGLGDVDLTKATLELTPRTTIATAPGVQLYSAANDWSSSSMTADRAPIHQDTKVADVTATPVVNERLVIPLTNLTTIDTTGSTTFELQYVQRYVNASFYSTGTNAPLLRLTLAGASSAPTATQSPSSTPTTSTMPTPSSPTTTAPAAGGSTTSSETAWDAAPITSDKKVFAHYFPPYPISLDNEDPANDYYARNFLSPSGESGKYASVGGFLRDRPLPRAPLDGDYQLADLSTEVNQAADAGVDGFTVDVLGISGRNWDITVKLMQAAQQSGRDFVVVPNLDANGSGAASDVDTLSDRLAELYSYSSAYQVSPGTYLLSSFKAEGKTTAWWTDLMNNLRDRHNVNVVLNAVLLNASDANMKAFAPISYSLSDWGTKNADAVSKRSNHAAKAHALGVKWMSPVSVQDVRPSQHVYAESRDTELLRSTWAETIDDGADLVQLVTWNDYSEGTSFAPSVAHGWSFLDLSQYYEARWKSGSTPTIKRDVVYVVHRRQPFAAVPLLPGLTLMTPNLGGSGTAPVDQVEVTTFLTTPATVTLKVGSTVKTFDAPAGQFIATAPLALGTVSATVVRSGTTTASVTSPYTVVAALQNQDLQYYAASSRGK